MGLLSKLKSLFGAGDDDGPRGSGVDVTVERAPDREPERSAEDPRSEADAGGAVEPVAEETDAAASTESVVDEEHTDDHTRAAEPSEAGVADVDESVDEPVDADDEPVDVDDEPPIEEAEADAEAETNAEAKAGAETEADSEAEPAADVEDADEPVDTVKGIGPAYADRLRDAGVETVGDLAAADPEDLADQVDLSAKRVGRWVDSANDR